MLEQTLSKAFLMSFEVVIEVLLMLKMLLYQDVIVKNLFICAPTWSEASLFFYCKFLSGGTDAILDYCQKITFFGWLIRHMACSFDTVCCILSLEGVWLVIASILCIPRLFGTEQWGNLLFHPHPAWRAHLGHSLKNFGCGSRCSSAKHFLSFSIIYIEQCV